VAFTLVALFTVDRWGRKPLLILGAVLMAISMIVLAPCSRRINTASSRSSP